MAPGAPFVFPGVLPVVRMSFCDSCDVRSHVSLVLNPTAESSAVQSRQTIGDCPRFCALIAGVLRDRAGLLRDAANERAARAASPRANCVAAAMKSASGPACVLPERGTALHLDDELLLFGSGVLRCVRGLFPELFRHLLALKSRRNGTQTH